MYSMSENGVVIVHKLPYNGNERDGMNKLQQFVERGFRFEKPEEAKAEVKIEVVKAEEVVEEIKVSEAEIKVEGIEAIMVPCPECGKLCKGAFGIEMHMKIHAPGYKRKKYKKK